MNKIVQGVISILQLHHTSTWVRSISKKEKSVKISISKSLGEGDSQRE